MRWTIGTPVCVCVCVCVCVRDERGKVMCEWCMCVVGEVEECKQVVSGFLGDEPEQTVMYTDTVPMPHKRPGSPSHTHTNYGLNKNHRLLAVFMSP